jgi:hypothetical protein
MATDSPPTFFFNGINFNPKYYENEVNNNITQSAGDARYLEKSGDTATGLIAFNSGLSSSGAITSTGATYGTGIIANKIDCTGSLATVFLDVSGSGNNGIRTYNGHIYSTGSGNISTNTGNISTTTGSITGGALSCTTITSNNNIITAGSSSVTAGSIISSTFNSGGISSVLDIGANQTSGILSIGNNTSRTGAINIGTLTTGTHAINIGNSSSTQTVNINRPLTTNSINTNNNTFTSGSGSITGGALSCTTINTNNNTITSGSGSITSTGLIKGGSFQNTAGSMTVASDGSMTGLKLTLNGVAGVSCYNLDIRNSSDNSYRGSINGLFGLFELKGVIECVGFYVKNFISNTTIAYINDIGNLSCNAITSNNNTITAGTGSIIGGALVCTTIQNNGNTLNCGNITCGTINSGTINTGNAQIHTTSGVNCNYTDISGTMYSKGIAVRNASNLDTMTVSTNGALSCTTITSNNNTITAGSSSVIAGSIISSTFNSGAPGSVLDIGANQTSGILSIGNNASRTGAINIGTLTTGAHAINIGNSASTQTVTINRPIRMPGLSYSNGNEIGYSQNDNITFSAFNPTPNPPLPGTLMNTPITTTNLINNANYLIKYSLIIVPQVSFNVTKLQYGLYTTGFVTSCSNNQSVNGLTSTGATTTTRFLTTDTYSYSGSGFFKYNSASSYSFSYFIDYLATAPVIVANIDLIRIS